MARMLIKVLEYAGHTVEIVSRLRAYLSDNTEERLEKLREEARAEVARISSAWEGAEKPDLWLTYHPYYRAPDFLGPKLAKKFGAPYVTVEASYSSKRDRDAWQTAQQSLVEAVRSAALNICFTRRDAEGLTKVVPEDRLANLPPFIDVRGFRETLPPHSKGDLRMIAIAMMRKGDKFDSYRMLAASLPLLSDIPWHLTVIGDGPLRDEIKGMFANIPTARITWVGEVAPDKVVEYLRDADLYCWPGCGEAYGLAYLEAQAAAVPVVAQATAGVPEVVKHEETGLLTPAGDIPAFADAIRRLSTDRIKLERLAVEARRFVLTERTLEAASAKLNAILTTVAERNAG
jgi:glycosyltransferase involved in cell wall biosynthesis